MKPTVRSPRFAVGCFVTCVSDDDVSHGARDSPSFFHDDIFSTLGLRQAYSFTIQPGFCCCGAVISAGSTSREVDIEALAVRRAALLFFCAVPTIRQDDPSLVRYACLTPNTNPWLVS